MVVEADGTSDLFACGLHNFPKRRRPWYPSLAKNAKDWAPQCYVNAGREGGPPPSSLGQDVLPFQPFRGVADGRTLSACTSGRIFPGGRIVRGSKSPSIGYSSK